MSKPFRILMRLFVSLLTALLVAVIVVSALAAYLGPDRHVVETVLVHDPANDMWEMVRITPPPPQYPWWVCYIQHTCDEHPSTQRQIAVCGWQADASSCTMAYTYETREYDLPEATVSGTLDGCILQNGWCVTPPHADISGSEPLAGQEIIAIEGTLNGQPFLCPAATCSVPLVEGENAISFWALSSYGDSSRMGMLLAYVDTRAPGISGQAAGTVGENGWFLSDVTVSAAAADPEPGSGLATFDVSVDGGNWSPCTEAVSLADGNHVVALRASDAAGHTTNYSLPVDIDTRPPEASLTLPANAFCPDCGGTLEIVLSARDGLSGVDGWTLLVDESLPLPPATWKPARP